MRPDSRPAAGAALALAECLHQFATLLDALTDVDYTWRHPSGVSGSIGAHVRHCLDHVQAILEPSDGTRVTYDHRQRATRTEQDRAYASEQLREAGRALAGTADRLEHDLTLDVQVERDGPTVSVGTSLGREVVFVLQHTIHHQALIALLLADQGASVPHALGYAPSTPRPDTAALACAR